MRQPIDTIRTLLALVAAVLLVACSSNKYPPAPTAAATSDYKYIIGPLDLVNIVVWRNPELSMAVPVRPDGRISTPLVEDVPALGKNPGELARDLEKALSKYIRDPVVTVIVNNFNGPSNEQIRIIGEAAKPQAVAYRQNMTVLDVMIQVGGLVTSVYAFSDNRKLPAGVDMDDTTSMLLKFAGGVTGYLSTLLMTADLYRVHVFGTKGWLELRGDTELTFRGLQGAPEKITLPAVDKEKAELEAFADAIAAKRPFLVPPEEAVNGIAVLEAIEVSAKKDIGMTAWLDFLVERCKAFAAAQATS